MTTTATATHGAKFTLDRLDAPAFWTRWAVLGVNGERIATVEKRGMGSGWYGYLDRPGYLDSPYPTRATALEGINTWLAMDTPIELNGRW